MKVSIIGGGAWGATLSQALHDNEHDVLIYDNNVKFVETINSKHIHPVFNEPLDENIKGTHNLIEAVEFANIYLLAVPIKYMRSVVKEINQLLNKKSLFINVSKGLEIDTQSFTSKIVTEEVNSQNLEGFVCLSGPSHAEEVILRKVTLLVSASNNEKHALFVQDLFHNSQYLRVYSSNDLIGVEVSGAVKNAIAVISGAASGFGLGENARAALITRGIREMILVVKAFGGDPATVYGLTGIGDLIVTASSTLSRNFKAGQKIGQGWKLADIYESEPQTIEGVNTIYALRKVALKNKIELPMIEEAYHVLENDITIEEGLSNLLSRKTKQEAFDI